MKLDAYLQILPCDYRLFLYRKVSKENPEDTFKTDNGFYLGAGIKAYPAIIGPVFVIMGIASKVIINSCTYYLNNQSMKKFFYRMFLVMPTTTKLENRLLTEILPKSPLSPDQNQSTHFKVNLKVWVKAMHKKYEDLQIAGYNKKILSLIDCNKFLNLLR